MTKNFEVSVMVFTDVEGLYRKHLKSNVLNDDHQIPNYTEGSIGEFAKQIKANDDSTNLVSQNLGSMPRV